VNDLADWNEVIQGMSNHGIDPSNSKEADVLVTSHSIDGTFDSCPRRFEFRHVIGQIPDIDESGFAAEVGTAMHEALQEWARTDSDEAGYITLMKWWPWELEEKKERADARNFPNALLLLRALMESDFWNEWEVDILPDGTHAIELPYRITHKSLGSFIHPRTGRPTYLADQGKIDFIIRHRVTHARRVLDLKTTTYDESLHYGAFRFSGQGAGYGMVLDSALGIDFRRNGMDVTYLLAEFSPYGPNVRPLEYHLSPEEVDDLITAKKLRLMRMLMYARMNHWPRRTHGCVFFNQQCAYLDVCERRDYPFLMDWFAAEDQRFRFKERIYEPYWTLEA